MKDRDEIGDPSIQGFLPFLGIIVPNPSLGWKELLRRVFCRWAGWWEPPPTPDAEAYRPSYWMKDRSSAQGTFYSKTNPALNFLFFLKFWHLISKNWRLRWELFSQKFHLFDNFVFEGAIEESVVVETMMDLKKNFFVEIILRTENETVQVEFGLGWVYESCRDL